MNLRTTDFAFMEQAAQQDADDALGHYREQFNLPEGLIYLDGNSLGPLPKSVPPAMHRLLNDEWGDQLIGGWNQSDWIGLPERLGARIAHVLGAQPHEVIACDSISVNLIKLIALALQAAAPRTKVLMDEGQFPTDGYVAAGLARLMGETRMTLHTVPRSGLSEALDDETAVIVLSHVHYVSSEKFDLKEWTSRAHDQGALVIWDLAHSAGVMPLELGSAGVDFATGCTYKFLCGGPGGPSFVYAADRLLNQFSQPLWGWMGHQDPFAFAHDYEPAEGARQFLTGTPSILAMTAAYASLALFLDLDLNAVQSKSRALTGRLIEGVAERGLDLKLATPRAPADRGSHVSFRHPSAYAIVQAMIEHGVIGDFRAPDILRFGIHPLVNGYQDIARCLTILQEVLEQAQYKAPRFSERQRVT